LPVSFPFHSQWIDEAKGPFESSMQSIPCTPGRLPLVCCDQAETLSDLPADFFWNVVRRPIRFRHTIARLEQSGVRRYIDVGPAGTLATFLKYTMPAATKSTVHPILTPFGADQKNLSAAVAAMRN
jgi:malonyl CoA-acyl carrier protein transacylase